MLRAGRSRSLRSLRRRRVLVVSLLASLAVGCGPPIGVKRVDPRTVHRTITQNVLTAGEPSGPTLNVLYRRALAERFDDDPEEALAALHAVALAEGGADDLFALAELSFLHAERTRKRSYYLAASVYAWTFLFPQDAMLAPSPFDPRFRTACDLYNRGITSGLESDHDEHVEIRSGTYALPFGSLEVTFDPAQLEWAGRTFTEFFPVAELEIRGLPTRFRWPGLGAPLAARAPVPAGATGDDFVAPRVVVPVTALLRLDGVRQELSSGQLRGALELHPAAGPKTMALEGKAVPLENESTATLAYMLAGSPIWKQELAGFFRSIGGGGEVQAQLRALEPYQPGRIPVVFIHGTASSAGRWAEMVNELANDPRLRPHYQFWFFGYDTGNPIAYSAMLLREALQRRVDAFDPERADPALARMVVIGHSQGGLLARTMVTESGGAFWKNISRKPIDELNLRDDTRELLRRAAFFHPLPFVRRVIFIATPQHGSYIAGSWVAQQVARLVSFPGSVMHAATDMVTFNRDAMAAGWVGRTPTAVDNMTPGHPFIRALASLPFAPGVHAHSIIAVKKAGAPQGQNDGVVEYDSAHIDGVDSELVVRSSHSCQGQSATITEVRRILLLHLQEGDAPATDAEPAASCPPS